MYNYMVNVAVDKKCSSSDGKTKIDCGGNLLHTDSHETLLALRYGATLCPPCDIHKLVTEPSNIQGILEKCPCRIPMTLALREAPYHILLDHLTPSAVNKLIVLLEEFGIGPEFMLLPWNPLEKPGGHNAMKTWWTPQCLAPSLVVIEKENCSNPAPAFSIFDVSTNRFGSCPFENVAEYVGEQIGGDLVPLEFDDGGLHNILPFVDASGDCSGALCGPSLVSIYGAYMRITSDSILFGNPCNSSYLPEGTFAFDVRTLMGAWLYLWEPLATPVNPVLQYIVDQFHLGGIYAARPRLNIDNYLFNFAAPAPLRFYRSKYWHA